MQCEGYYGGVRLLMAICKVFYNTVFKIISVYKLKISPCHMILIFLGR